ncbi:ABC transporter substrate-binding protein [Blautia schinkii]|nr:ABC transporter substrate-binding protein [Blautia schinkii]
MKRKKRIIIMLCIVLCAAAFLQTRNIWSAGKTDGEEPPYELVMQWPASGKVPAGLKDVEQALNVITEDEIGVTIRLKACQSPAFEANLMIAAGDKLDLCVSMFGSMPELINNGYLIQLDSLMDTKGQELKKVCGVQLEGGYYQDHIYGIPTVYSEGWRYGMICRTDFMEKYGFETEEGKYYSFDELEEFFQRVKDGEGEDFYILGGNLTCGGDLLERSGYAFDVLGAGIETGVLLLGSDNNPDKIVNFYETKEFEEFARRMYRWQNKGFFVPDTAISEDSPNLLMRDGRTLGWFFHNVPGEEKENTSDSGLDVTFIPTMEAVRTTDTYQTVLWSIPITCENPEKVMEFLELLYTDERVCNLLQRGIEGASYVVEEENEEGKLIALPEGETIDTLPYYAHLGVFGNRLDAYTWVPGEIDRNRRIKEFSDSISRTSPAWGYVFDQEPTALEISRVKEVIKKYIGVIETGAADPDVELPMFLDELKAAGIDKVIEENQRQYDLWRDASGR